MLEKQIEAKVCDYAKTKNVLVYKFTSPARAAVPDRLFIRADGRMWFCRPGWDTSTSASPPSLLTPVCVCVIYMPRSCTPS